MATSDHRIPANQVVWLLAGLLAIWVGWLFVPKSEKPRVVSQPVMTESKLRAVGLPDNPDWEGLPELFAVWSAQAPWQDGKVQFAYWNPGAHAYSYFFEAIQSKGLVRFRVLSTVEALQRKEFIDPKFVDRGLGGFFWETSIDRSASQLAAVEFGTDSPMHPFVFFQVFDPLKNGGITPSILMEHAPGAPRPPSAPLPSHPLLPIDLKPPPLPDVSPKK